MTSSPLAIPTRQIELPRSISPQAQAVLGGAYANRKPAVFPSLQSPAAWRQWIDEREAPLAPVVDAFIAGPGASLEERDMRGARVWVSQPEVNQLGRPAAQFLIHGGGWVFGGGRITQAITKLSATLSGGAVYGVDYRMPPEHPYPAALDDCLAAYVGLLDEFDPQDILVMGQSAGGNLAAALMHRLKDEGLPKPRALMLDTPAVDLTMASDSLYTNEVLDSAIGLEDLKGGLLYAGGNDLTHPYLSPINGDHAAAFPATYLRTGTRDLLLSDTVRMHTKLRAAGVEADLYVVEGMPHGGFDGITRTTPEDQEAHGDLWRWVSKQFAAA